MLGALLSAVFGATFFGQSLATQPVIRVGSKHFTEGYVLAELVAQTLESRGFRTTRVHGLGGTMVCFSALANNEIDVYPEYTGTVEQEILHTTRRLSDEEIGERLRADHQIVMLPPFGFDNTYAITMTRPRATELGVATISHLASRPELSAGFSYEFLRRQDGWPSLAKHYGLSFAAVGMEHSLAYDALRGGSIDLTDGYSTDAKIARYQLATLDDDRKFFPRYAAVPLVRAAVAQVVAPALLPLAGRLDEAAMRSLNARVEIERVPFAVVAHDWLVAQGIVDAASEHKMPGLAARLLQRTWRHLWLTGVALLLALAVAIPLGVAAHFSPRLGMWVVAGAGLLQTIPSIALLALLIPLWGIGVAPAIVALFLYGLLPIVRNTYVGLQEIEPQYRIAALAMGLTPFQRLRWVEFPLALPVIMAGVKTAAVINIGTATLAAFIGAGGLGEPIVTGLALNDTSLILEGTIPAAALALAVELLFRLVGRRH